MHEVTSERQDTVSPKLKIIRQQTTLRTNYGDKWYQSHIYIYTYIYIYIYINISKPHPIPRLFFKHQCRSWGPWPKQPHCSWPKQPRCSCSRSSQTAAWIGRGSHKRLAEAASLQLQSLASTNPCLSSHRANVCLRNLFANVRKPLGFEFGPTKSSVVAGAEVCKTAD